MSEYCIWKQTKDESWYNSHGQMVMLFEDGPIENGFKFCPHCGREIKELRLFPSKKEDV